MNIKQTLSPAKHGGQPSQLGILAVSDLHYIGQAKHTCRIEARQTGPGPLLIEKALRHARQQNLPVDLIIILGDVLDNGMAAGAEEDLKTVCRKIKELGPPVLAVRGNHDCPAEVYTANFDSREGLHKIGDYGFLVFHDDVAADDYVTRPQRYFDLLEEYKNENMPLVALQHNPIYPEIVSEYPYMPVNAAAIRDSYEQSPVFLSISGHYHGGGGPESSQGVVYRVLPALCEAPYAFDHIKLIDNTAEFTPLKLQVPGNFLVDNHLHTEYAYCATSVNVKDNIKVSQLMGLQNITLTEHAFHLYFPSDEAWSMRWQRDLDMVKRAYDNPDRRMKRFRDEMLELKETSNGCLHLGLEVDLCADGTLLLAAEDSEGWELLIGAVHGIKGEKDENLNRREAEKLFLRENERLLTQPIQVLAHPFRWFRRKGMEIPGHLFAPLAEMLAQAGVAAEINYHTNDPDARFVEECLSRGVKISLATDSHDIIEVGDLHPHLQLLKKAGVRKEDLHCILFKPY